MFWTIVDLQDVHDDARGPAVHWPAVPLPADHLRSCMRARQPHYFCHNRLQHLWNGVE